MKYLTMVRARSQLEYVSKDKLVVELLSIENISSKLANLMARSYNFSRRFEILSSELPVSTNCKLQSSSKQTNHPARKKCSQQCTISLTQIDKP